MQYKTSTDWKRFRQYLLAGETIVVKDKNCNFKAVKEDDYCWINNEEIFFDNCEMFKLEFIDPADYCGKEE